MTIATAVENQPHQAKHAVWPETKVIWEDEKALLLIERDEMAPDSSGFRRYQTIFVARNDALAKYMEDMGPSSLYIASGFDIPGGDPGNPLGQWEETVGELRDWANVFREWLVNREMRKMPDLINGFYDHVEQSHRAAGLLPQIGTHYRIGRN